MNKLVRYIDCDGVILDTESGLFNEYYKLKEKNNNLKKLVYLQQLNWYDWIRRAGVINNAIDILKEQNPSSAAIITKVHSLMEGQIKIEFFREHGIKNNIIIVPSTLSKSAVVQAGGSLLVDDSAGNLEDWRCNGGISFLFKKDEIAESMSLGEPMTSQRFPIINNLEFIFSEETEEYCKRLRLRR